MFTPAKLLRLLYGPILLISCLVIQGAVAAAALRRNATSGLQERLDNVAFFYHHAGQGVTLCGSTDRESDFVVSLDYNLWDGGAHCFEKISVEYQGKTAVATITDACVTCEPGGLDLSVALFEFLAGSTANGIIYGSWNYVSAVGASTP